MFWWIKKVHFAIWDQSLLISRMAGYQELYRLRQTITGSQKHWLSFISDKCVFNQFYFHPVHKVSQERLPWGQGGGGGEGGGGRCGGGEGQDLHWLWQASEVHPVREDCLSKVWKLDLFWNDGIKSLTKSRNSILFEISSYVLFSHVTPDYLHIDKGTKNWAKTLFISFQTLSCLWHTGSQRGILTLEFYFPRISKLASATVIWAMPTGHLRPF